MTVAANDNAIVRYATVCSGIEGVSAAWGPLGGFQPVFFSEIERFPSAVLAHHFPNVQNLGDFTNISGADWSGKVDVLWGSTPCQSLSIAGKREGLSDPRGQLTLKFVELADTINPNFIAWENVKNALSIQKGSVFGQFLGALAGSGCELRPPVGAKWGHAGYVDGPRRIVAWRLFDAQYGGVAQRRERLFVVGCSRTSCHDPRDILFEREGTSRNQAPSDQKGQGQVHAAAALGGIVYVNGDSRPKFSLTTAHTLKAASGNGGRACIAYRDPNGMAQIRELLPVEWERLQGFPDGWTDIEWRGRPAPKTVRKKALGNSLAIPDVRWIGARIKASVDGSLARHDWPDLPRSRRAKGLGDFDKKYFKWRRAKWDRWAA
jgi:DNA (cytosine-5)-methyltransferase 1